MDGRCKDCRYWEAPDGLGTFTCYDRVAQKGWRVCGLTVVRGYKVVAPTSRAIADEFDGRNTALHTAPDFGCVQFETKEG